MSETKTSIEERNHESPREAPPAAAEPGLDATRANRRTFHENLVRRFRAELGKPSGGTMALVDALLRDAYRERASDIHLDSESNGLRVRFRVDGVVLDTCLLGRGAGRRLVNQFKGMARIDPVAMFVPEEARFTYVVEGREIGFRVEVAPCLPGDKLTVRILEPNRVQQRLGHLGLSEDGLIDIKDWLGNVNGMFLVAGPTGSGKTTTLYALLHEFKLLERNVVSIEDPVECQIDGINQIQVDEPRGLTFAKGIKATLRLDPDFMLVGEVRDHSSATAAIDAAVTGRTLMSTVHSRDAVGAVTVLRNFGLGDHEIASVLSMLVNQRLVRKLCRECRRRERPTEAEMRWLLAAELPIPESTWHPVGCDACHGLGFYGRTGVFEVWRVDEEDRVLLLDHAPESIIREALAAKDHQFLLTDGLAKVEAGVTSLSELKTMGGLGWRSPSPGAIGG